MTACARVPYNFVELRAAKHVCKKNGAGVASTLSRCHSIASEKCLGERCAPDLVPPSDVPESWGGKASVTLSGQSHGDCPLPCNRDC